MDENFIPLPPDVEEWGNASSNFFPDEGIGMGQPEPKEIVVFQASPQLQSPAAR